MNQSDVIKSAERELARGRSKRNLIDCAKQLREDIGDGYMKEVLLNLAGPYASICDQNFREGAEWQALASTHEVPVGEQRIQFLEKALQQATESMEIVKIGDEHLREIAKSNRHVGQEVILNIGFSERFIDSTEASSPELFAYLREKAPIPIPNTDGAVGLQEQG